MEDRGFLEWFETTWQEYTLRVTQVCRCEGGTWKVIHRHGDHETSAAP